MIKKDKGITLKAVMDGVTLRLFITEVDCTELTSHIAMFLLGCTYHKNTVITAMRNVADQLEQEQKEDYND